MDLLWIGSANQYAKNMARRTQWNLKRQSGDFTEHKKSLQDYVNITKASSVLPQTDEADNKMSAIMTKAQAGKKLSPDEWEYLRAKNPMLYEKLREIEKEQENYEKALKRCKTKDEARRLHMSKLGDVMTAAKNGDESALYRLNRLTRTMTAFTKSEEYRKMPTEAEEAVERERERTAEREAELREAELAEREAELREAERGKAEEEAASEAEEEAAPQAEQKAASEAEEEAAPQAEQEAESVSGRGADAKMKPVGAKPKTESGFKATKSDHKAKDAAGIPFAAPSHAPDAGRASREPERAATPAAPFGQQAYLNQMGAERPRRRAVDAKA